jgi:hypothetical protein
MTGSRIELARVTKTRTDVMSFLALFLALGDDLVELQER